MYCVGNPTLAQSLARYYPPSFGRHRATPFNSSSGCLGEVIQRAAYPERDNLPRLHVRIQHVRHLQGLLGRNSYLPLRRNSDVWGSDAQIFRPERWLEQNSSKAEAQLGVYGDM